MFRLARSFSSDIECLFFGTATDRFKLFPTSKNMNQLNFIEWGSGNVA